MHSRRNVPCGLARRVDFAQCVRSVTETVAMVPFRGAIIVTSAHDDRGLERMKEAVRHSMLATGINPPRFRVHAFATLQSLASSVITH